MTNYRRNIPPGGSYFFTVNLAERRLSLLTDNIALLRRAFRYVRGRHLFTVEAIVVLPDHLHAIWILPKGDADYSLQVAPHQIGVLTCAAKRGARIRESLRKRRRGIWQGVIGNTHCVTKQTSRGTWITFISTR